VGQDAEIVGEDDGNWVGFLRDGLDVGILVGAACGTGVGLIPRTGNCCGACETGVGFLTGAEVGFVTEGGGTGLATGGGGGLTEEALCRNPSCGCRSLVTAIVIFQARIAVHAIIWIIIL